MLVKLVTTKCLLIIIVKTFLKLKKGNFSSPVWKHILDYKKLSEKGLLWVLGNGVSINFWYGNCCGESAYQQLNFGMEYYFNHQAKVCHFISSSKERSLDNLKGIIPIHLITRVRFIPISNIEDTIICNDNSVKTAT